MDQALETMQNAAGSSDREMGIIRDSLEYKLNSLKQTWVGTLTEIADRKELGNAVDGLTSLSEGLGGIISKLGVLKTAIIGIGTVIGSQKLGLFNTKDSTTLLGSIVQSQQSKIDATSYKRVINDINIEKDNPNWFTNLDISKYSYMSDKVKGNLISIQEELKNTSGTGTDAINKINTLMAESVKQSNKLNNAFSKVGKTIVNGLASAVISTGISFAISAIVQAVYSLLNSFKQLSQRLNEISTNYKDSKAELNNYARDISKLRGIMEDEASTTEQVKDATSKLYDIQNKLVATYGGYAAGIDLVNGKLETQLGILNEIDKKNYQQWQNEAESTKSTKAAATSMGAKVLQSVFLPFLGGINMAKDYFNLGKGLLNGDEFADAFKDSFGGTDIFGKDYGLEVFGNQLEEATEKYENFKASIKATDDSKINDIIDSFDEFEVVNGKIEISGRVDKVADSLERLQVELKNVGYENENLNRELTKFANKSRKLATDLSSTYANKTYGEIIQSKELLEIYFKLQEAYQQYQEAISSGDQKQIDEAVKNLQDNIGDIENSSIKEKYKDYFESLYPDIQNIVSNWKIEFQIIPTLKDTDVEDFIKNHSTEEIITEYNKYIMQGTSYIDSNGYKVFFERIQSYARLAKVDVAELIMLLHQADGLQYSGNLDKIKTRNTKSKNATKVQQAEESGDEYFDREHNLKKIKLPNQKNTSTTPTTNWAMDSLIKKDDFTQSALEASNDVIDKWYNNLSDAYKEGFDNLDLSDEEVKVFLSFTNDLERDQWLYKMLHEGTTTIEVKTKTTDLVSDLDTFEDKIDSLATAYESAVTNATHVAASDLQSLNDDFGGMKDDNGDYTAMASSIEKFNDTVTQNIGNTDGANQTAVNELLTSYLDLSGTLENLIDEGEDYAKQVLENQGVENAEEVVTSRLNKTYKATRANLVNLTKALNGLTTNGTKYLDVLESGVREGQDFEDTCEGLVKSVSELVGVYNQDTGKFMEGADIDADFVKANIEDIIDAYTGVDGALDKLYEDVALFNAQKVYVEAGLDDTEVKSKLTGIQSLLDIASTWTMEPQALLENSQFMQTLQDCWDGTEETANAINAALGTIGMKVEYKTTTKKIRVAKASDKTATSIPTNVGDKSIAGKTVTADTIEVDDFEVVATNTGKGTTGSNAKYTGSPSSSSNSGGSGDGSDSSSNSEETFDWIEVAIDRLENNLDKLGETVDSTYEKWESRNKAITKSIDEVNREIELQEEGAAEYLKKAESIDLSEDWKKKVREGKIEIDTVSDDTLKTNIQNYQTWWEKYQDAMDKSKTLTQTIQGYYKQLFDNVSSQYDQLLDDISSKTELIDERISRMEEHGYFVDEQYYKKQQSLEEENQKTLVKERAKLIEKLEDAVSKGTIKKGSESWQEMYQKIQDVNKQIEESKTKMVELNNTILELQWSKFDWIEERMKDINEEATFLQNILSNKNLFSEDVVIEGETKNYSSGKFSNAGMASAALTMARYDEDIAAARRYTAEIEKLDKKLANDPNNTKLIEKKEEYVQAQRESIEAAEQEKQAIKSLIQEAIEKNIEALNKLIEKYNDSLQAAKDLYDYQKNIADQTKNIASLEKQLAAYQNDTSEEARKKRLELQQQLDESRTNLKETQWDKYISETSEMLSDMSEDYQNFLNSKLDDVMTVIKGVTNKINNNKKAVSDGLKEISNEYGITTQNFEDFRKNTYSKSQAGIVSAFNNANTTFKNGWSNAKAAILEVNRTLLSKQTDVTKTNNDANGSTTNNEKAETKTNGKGKTVTVGNQSMNLKETATGNVKLTPTGSTEEDKNFLQDEKNKAKAIADDEKQKSKTESKTKVTPKNAWWRGKWYDAKGKVVSKYSLGQFVWDSTGQWYRYAVAGNKEWQWEKDCSRTIDGKIYYFNSKGYVIQDKTKKAPGYAKGTSNVPEDQLAWTQEQGSELIYRTTDGAILTPLNQGDMVFTHDMTQRLWEIAKNNIPTGTQGAAVVRSTANFGDSNVNASFTINLPNVKNYDQFKKELQNDNNFEKFVKEITIGQLNGNNTLNKRKY